MRPGHLRACTWLVVGTLLWGLSFCLIKAIQLGQNALVPGASSWFTSSLVVAFRFGLAGLIVLAWCLPTLRQLTRSEWRQGIGLAVVGSIGVLIQMDGLNYTEASTSAFLTQFTCLLVPVWIFVHRRVRPTLLVTLGCVLVLVGVAVLAGLRLDRLKLGRGELETLISAAFFSAQILWLERPEFRANRTSHFTLIMFLGSGLLFVPPTLLTMPDLAALGRAVSSPVILMMLIALTLACTLGAYGLMNRWQPHVTATEAGVIYCVEPLFTSVFALFLPGWLSRFAGVDYANEQVTSRLLIGGGLITLANLLVQWNGAREARAAAARPGSTAAP